MLIALTHMVSRYARQLVDFAIWPNSTSRIVFPGAGKGQL